MPWVSCAEPGPPAPRGSEGGIIAADEEHDEWGARITLERDTTIAPAAITCGLYGWMVHTRYFKDPDVARREYEAMKADLSTLVSLVPLAADPDLRTKTAVLTEAIAGFVRKYP